MRKAILGAVLLMMFSGSAQATPIGPAVILRSQVDSAYEITFINITQAIPESGVIDFWQVWNATSASQTARLQVFRPIGTEGYQLLGENDLTVAPGFNQVSVPLINQISVQVNDLIGFRYDAVRFIPYEYRTPVTTIWTFYPSTTTDIAPGGVLLSSAFDWDTSTGSGLGQRSYSFAANVVSGSTVPEPGSSLLLLGIGLGGLRAWRKRLG